MRAVEYSGAKCCFNICSGASLNGFINMLEDVICRAVETRTFVADSFDVLVSVSSNYLAREELPLDTINIYARWHRAHCRMEEI